MKEDRAFVKIETFTSRLDGSVGTHASVALPGGRKVDAFAYGESPATKRKLRAELVKKLLEAAERSEERAAFSARLIVADGGNLVVVTEPGGYRILVRGRSSSVVLVGEGGDVNALARKHAESMATEKVDWEATI